MTDIVDKQREQIAKFVGWVGELLIEIEEEREERRNAVAALSEQVDKVRAAAEEIRTLRARLRAEIDRKNLTIQALTEERDEVVRMANKLTAERDEIAEVKRLTPIADAQYSSYTLAGLYMAERDRARRLVCELQCDPPERFIGLPHEVAQMYGWDCFPEVTP